MRQWENVDWDVSEAAFERMLLDSRVEKMTLPGGLKRVSVMKQPETLVKRARTFTKGLRSTGQPLETEAEAVEALAELGQVGTGSTTLSPAIFGSFARAVQPAGVVGTTTGVLLPNDEARDGPGISAVAALANMEGIAPPHTDTLPPGATAAPEPKKRSGPKPKYLRDCTGVLEEGRQAGWARLTQLLADYGKGSKNPATRTRAAYKRALVQMADEESLLCTEFEKAVLRVETAKSKVHEWGLGDVEKNMTSVEALAVVVIEQAAELEAQLKTWLDARAAFKNKKLGTQKKGSQQFRKDTALYRGSVPSKVLHWLTGKNFWKEEGRAKVLGEAKLADPAVDQWDAGQPCLWEDKDTDEGPLRWWVTLMSCWGPRLEQNRATLVKTVATRPDLRGKVLMQTRPAESRKDTYLDETWVPDHCKDPESRPAGLATFGAPWHLYENAAVWRGDCVDLAMPGIGQVWYQETGMRLLLMWPVSACVSKGCAAADAWDWLFGDQDMALTPSCFQAWASANLSWVVIQQGDAAWVPWGYQMASLNLASAELGTGPAEGFVQPFFSRGLAQICPSLGDVGRHLMTEAARCKTYGDKTWRIMADGLIAWLEEELKEAMKTGRKGAVALVITEDVCGAKTRELKRTTTLDANAYLDSALGEEAGDGKQRKKRARVTAASQDSAQGTRVEAERPLQAVADGDVLEENKKEGEQEEAPPTGVVATAEDATEDDGATAAKSEPPAGPAEPAAEKPAEDDSSDA